MVFRLFHTNHFRAVRSEQVFSSGLRLFCALFVVICCAAMPTFAQNRDTAASARAFQPVETMLQQPISTSATRTTAATMTKDPVLAVALSLIPGLGQIYVESYWKAPIFLAGFGTAIGFTIYNANLVALADSILAVSDSTRSSTFLSSITRQREIFRDLRDISIVAIVGVIGLAAIDAYVGAHLFDFDVSDEFKAALRVNPLQGRINLTIRHETQENWQERAIREELSRTKP
ncbi:MAG: DUF5683 domain-containing protein [Candidatus Kapabacteria bacterium]|jgi:hypothetical protein|nr:DUF5683 domain-containing protein [Candidatus Kapabacteria bacterium]